MADAAVAALLSEPKAEPSQTRYRGALAEPSPYPAKPREEEISSLVSQFPAAMGRPVIASMYQQALWPAASVVVDAGPLPCADVATLFVVQDVSVAWLVLRK